MPMISKTNPIHRVNEINDRLNVLAHQMEPFYAASRLVSKDNTEDYGALEWLPVFRVLWVEASNLRAERDEIHIRLALAYEQCPVPESPFPVPRIR